MPYTRRRTLELGATTLAAIGLSTLLPRTAFAQSGGDSYPTDNGEITVHPVSHASLVMTVPNMVIYVDPVGGADAYDGFDTPDLVLITHEHGDHYEAETLSAIVGDDTRLITNPAVFDMLPEDLKSKAEALANGESTTIDDLTIDAIPAYNTTEDRLQYHPEGRDNGYVLGIDGKRVYIAGDTEDIPEMRALENIDIAFVPMNLPYTMDVAQAASGVGAFAPTHVYPYHYRDSDIDEFESLLAEEGVETEVVRGDWY
ncbi:MAG TPA: MBL fold metallo-hydrolase [Devosiaceae bacterium]|jgi:L-ascorbate metabolism protein UlaG (beta-lactamase superfamily)|nr:MBL fold metallo-hydrolase [Devosiaceae bacterium]